MATTLQSLSTNLLQAICNHSRTHANTSSREGSSAALGQAWTSARLRFRLWTSLSDRLLHVAGRRKMSSSNGSILFALMRRMMPYSSLITKKVTDTLLRASTKQTYLDGLSAILSLVGTLSTHTATCSSTDRFHKALTNVQWSKDVAAPGKRLRHYNLEAKATPTDVQPFLVAHSAPLLSDQMTRFLPRISS